MIRKFTTEELALTSWDRWESNDHGRWGLESIKAANLAYQSRVLHDLLSAANSIQNTLRALEQNGLHQVIREQARKAREAERKRKARAKARRAKARQADRRTVAPLRRRA